jgi:M6 family metalloprotease-like protein
MFQLKNVINRFVLLKEFVTMFTKKSTILFGIFVFVITLSFLITNPAHAAPIVNFPVTVTQPDGTKLNLFASGDEFYNWLHDADGYTVMQHPTTGYYVYADLIHGELIPTRYVVGKVDPAEVGLSPGLNILPEKMGQIRQQRIAQTSIAAEDIRNAPKTGTINNLVVFIRFAGDSEYTDATTTYTGMLNDSTSGANSMKNYYTEVSYGTLTVDSTVYPTPPGSTVVSFQDSHSRGYFQPYHVATNPIGYTDSTQSRLREHALLRDAIAYVNTLGQFPNGASIDGDNDGNVDGITFVVIGNPDGWSDLLWPHMWVLYSYDVWINGKQVWNYSFHLQNHLKVEGGVSVLAHEMFHALGAPDLYHYSYDGLEPVGSWDVMEDSKNPPQHMGCYMKATYGGWISSIPELISTGTYTLNPLTSSTNNCYKIASPNSTDEYFVVEYRKKTGTFESSIPGTGLLVYRINSTVDDGNMNGPPDEVYIYRPGGTTTVNGSVNTANFSSNVGRTAINDVTDPSSFLSDGSAGGLDLCNIGASNATISFDICSITGFAISGNAGVGGATLSYTDGTPKTATADGSGLYSFVVPSGWSGTVTPSKTGYTFSPVSRSYTNVLANQTEQNYTATPTGTYRIYLPLLLKNFADTPPGAFNKTAPINGATGQPANPTLSWGASSNAASYEYCIDTSNNNACDATWTSTAASTSIGLSDLSPSTSYYWQVRANNSSGTTYANDSSTDYWSFTTADLPPPGIVNGDFESGSTGWTEYSAQGWPIIVTSFPSGITARSGSYAAWLGGDFDEISIVQQQVTISAGAPYLVYWHWIASDDICGWDFGGVVINGSVEDVYDLCTTTNTGGWVKHSVNLNAYAGQSVTLQIRAETDSSGNSNLFVDDVSLQASGSAPGQINGVVPNLDASATQGKIGIVVQGVKPQGINEKRLLNPR